MKAMLLPLAGVDQAGSASEEPTPSEKGAAEGFDAVLALVAAQAAPQTPAAKLAAPVAQLPNKGVPALAANSNAPARPVPASAAAEAALVGFTPWLSGELAPSELEQNVTAPAAQQTEQLSADAAAESEDAQEQEQILPAQQDPRGVALPFVAPAPAAQLPATPRPAASKAPVAIESAAGRSAQAAKVQVAPSASEREAQAAQAFQGELLALQGQDAAPLGDTAQLPAATQQVAQQQLPTAVALPSTAAEVDSQVQPAATLPATLQGAQVQAQAQQPRVEQAPARPQPETLLAEPQVESMQRPPAAQVQAAPAPAQQLQAQQPAAAPVQAAPTQVAPQRRSQPVQPQVEATTAPTQAAPQLSQSAAQVAAQREPARAPAETLDIDALESASVRISNVVVVGPAAQPASAESVQQPTQPQLNAQPAPEAQQLANEPAQVELVETQREPARDEQAPELQAAASAPRAPQPAPLHTAEVQGVRGLEAVVASLLRAGSHDASVQPASARVSAQPALKGPLLETQAATEASAMRVKLAEGAAGAENEATGERDEREPLGHEALELPLPHAAMQLEPAPHKDKLAEPAPALPMPVAPQLLDADGVHPGKPGQEGASITIDHPELGAMDLLVQSQNGRIEVRAILETPHAAQVLRAQESALRYGIQQAGMTFGALRVRTRTGDGQQTVATRDNVKRRRDHEWEA